MNSLDIIKQELVNQKSLLEQKGFPVATTHTNPSPSEITNAIRNIELNFALADATAEDVSLGKTFYAQTNELKTGTLDVAYIKRLSEIALCVTTGVGSQEVFIPTEPKYTKIRAYSFYCYEINDDLFYKHNLTIPENIRLIGIRAFYGANLTGKLTIPATCNLNENGIFQYSKITEVQVSSSDLTGAISALSYCPNLKKAVIDGSVETIPSNFLAYNYALEELELPPNLTSLAANFVYKGSALKLVKFTSPTPVTLAVSTFSHSINEIFIVPYTSYNAYYTATNYASSATAIYGYGEFNQGATLPSSISGYTITWYTSVDNAKASTNPVTTCPSSGTMYGVFKSV